MKYKKADIFKIQGTKLGIYSLPISNEKAYVTCILGHPVFAL
jgi:hypothetical protein